MSGRTHLQHALPTSFGYKCSTWLSGIERHIDRIKEIKEDYFTFLFWSCRNSCLFREKNGLGQKTDLLKN